MRTSLRVYGCDEVATDLISIWFDARKRTNYFYTNKKATNCVHLFKSDCCYQELSVNLDMVPPNSYHFTCRDTHFAILFIKQSIQVFHSFHRKWTELWLFCEMHWMLRAFQFQPIFSLRNKNAINTRCNWNDKWKWKSRSYLRFG